MKLLKIDFEDIFSGNFYLKKTIHTFICFFLCYVQKKHYSTNSSILLKAITEYKGVVYNSSIFKDFMFSLYDIKNLPSIITTSRCWVLYKNWLITRLCIAIEINAEDPLPVVSLCVVTSQNADLPLMVI